MELRCVICGRDCGEITITGKQLKGTELVIICKCHLCRLKEKAEMPGLFESLFPRFRS